MNTPENSFFPLTLYHLLTSVNDTTERNLRSIVAVSTFASESVVREFTALEERPQVIRLISCGRRREVSGASWIPAFAGMTGEGPRDYSDSVSLYDDFGAGARWSVRLWRRVLGQALSVE